MALTTLDIRVTDLEPVKRLIAAVAAFAHAAERDSYSPPELAALLAVIAELRQEPEPTPPRMVGLDGRLAPFRAPLPLGTVVHDVRTGEVTQVKLHGTASGPRHGITFSGNVLGSAEDE